MEEKQKIRLKYRPGAMTLNDMCILESPPSHVKIRELLAKHFVNGNGEYVNDLEAAAHAVGEVPKEEIFHLITDLWRQINEYKNQDDDPN